MAAVSISGQLLYTGAMSYFVITPDRARADRWQKLFGADRLPVLAPVARWQLIDGQERPAYDLDLAALHQGQRDRLAGHVAKRTGRPYPLVKTEIDNSLSWPVVAAGCVVVIDEVTAADWPSLFLWARGRKSEAVIVV